MAVTSAGSPAMRASTRSLRLVAVTHGRPTSANRAAIIRLVDAVASSRPALDVSIAFIDARAREPIELVADRDEGAVIVPLVLSAGFHVRTGLELGIAHSRSHAGLAAGLGPDDRIVDVLARRLDRTGLDDDDVVVLAAAGSNDPRAVRECFETARRLGLRLGRPVTVGFIAAGLPRLRDAIEMIRELHRGRRVVVGPYLLAPGQFYDAILTSGADVVADALLTPDASAPAELVDLVLARFDETRPDTLPGA
ncbi:CbiX/SirB N-terminal domain-containing protein [Agromyces sp. H3Y2-19a]|jgi:sirohydrochlorin ferrochelatase|uniref:sirohydrochlorin chelatase n=1 Tax=Agromyces TaxID=33877 RepID=UPI001E2F7A19|nr:MULTISPECIES: CbiX/SirB N-terminal domain-containing protein [Agromyces]MCD5346882.1 cobalamin biosynthesis protein CbiX [Agromyces sp. S2-1-8]MDF0515072.1 CbiX/SirB N-terminal domain-containing protein [Agromyces chromiiresistens]